MLNTNCLESIARALGGAYYSTQLRATCKCAAASIPPPRPCTADDLMMSSVKASDVATYQLSRKELDCKVKKMGGQISWSIACRAGKCGCIQLLNIMIADSRKNLLGIWRGVYESDNVEVYSAIPHPDYYKGADFEYIMQHNSRNIFDHLLAFKHALDVNSVSYCMGAYKRFDMIPIFEKHGHEVDNKSFTEGICFWLCDRGILESFVEYSPKYFDLFTALHVTWYRDTYFAVLSYIKSRNLMTMQYATDPTHMADYSEFLRREFPQFF